jgi:hypothetical protein
MGAAAETEAQHDHTNDSSNVPVHPPSVLQEADSAIVVFRDTTIAPDDIDNDGSMTCVALCRATHGDVRFKQMRMKTQRCIA